jgi:hypothetical protein
MKESSDNELNTNIFDKCGLHTCHQSSQKVRNAYEKLDIFIFNVYLNET